MWEFGVPICNYKLAAKRRTQHLRNKGHPIVKAILDFFYEHNLDVVILNPEESKRYSLLHKACESGHTNIVKVWLEHPFTQDLAKSMVDVEDNIEGSTPLLLACYVKSYGIAEMAKSLIEFSIKHDVDLRLDVINSRQMTALQYACWKGNVDIVKLLLNYHLMKNHIRIDLNVRDGYGRTPIMMACKAVCKRFYDSEGYDQIVKLLLDFSRRTGLRINTNIRDNDEGITPLVTAIKSGQMRSAWRVVTYKIMELSPTQCDR